MTWINVKRIGNHSLPLPAYAREGDAGMDLRADETTTIDPGYRAVIGCGFAFEIPPGFEGQVRGRSGMAKAGIVVPTGTVDSGYRGAVGVVVFNHTSSPRRIEYGDRIAQFVIAPVARCTIIEVAELSETERGAQGFGSSGLK